MIGRRLLGRWGRTDTGLGPAVTGLPTGPLHWAPLAAEPAAPPVASAVPVRVAPAEPPDPPVAGATAPPPVGLQVVLGFRDGSEAQLDPESAQARALEGIALTLAARD